MNGNGKCGDVFRVRAPRSLREALEREAARRKVTMSAVIRAELSKALGVGDVQRRLAGDGQPGG